MTPNGLILPLLCLFQLLCIRASAQEGAPKPAGMLPEAQQWVREHAGDVEQGAYLAERLRDAKAIVLVDATPGGRCSSLTTRCIEQLLARKEAPLVCLSAGWEDVRVIDSWLASGKGPPGALLAQPALDVGYGWNSDEKNAAKVRAAGIEYRATREQVLGLVAFITRIDPQLEQRASQLLGPFRQTGADGHHRYDKVDENWRFSVRQILSDLSEQSGERRDAWEGVVGPAGYLAGMRNLQRLMQAEQEVSQPEKFRRGRALCLNAAAAREELAPKATLLVSLPMGTPLEREEAHELLGAGSLLVHVLAPDDPDAAALAGVRATGALDLREVPRTGLVANWFAEHFGKRADLVVWTSAR